MDVTDFAEHLGRPERRCGIHDDDTTSGRCPTCDADRDLAVYGQHRPEPGNSAACPDQNLAHASRRDEDYL